MADGSGYNPYRKANGEFASRDEVGDLNEKLASDLVDAQDAGDEKLAAQIEDYAIEKLPESPIGRKLLEERYGVSATASKAGPDYSKLGIRELQREAKDTEDEALQDEIARRGNSAALKNLARNPKASTVALESAYIRTDDDSVRLEIAANPNSDTAIMHPRHVAHAAVVAHSGLPYGADKELAQRLRKRAESILDSESMDDVTVAELARLHAENNRSWGPSSPLVHRAMGNPRNLITEDAALEYAKSSPRAGGVALESGKISPQRIGELSASSARFEHVTDPAILRRAAMLSASGHWDTAQRDPYGEVDEFGREGREVAERILKNEHTPAEALDRFVGNERVDQSALYTHPNVSPEAKQILEETQPSVQSHLRIKRAIGDSTQADLVHELRVSGGSTSTRTGYHSTHMQFDREKVAAAGLTGDDMNRLLGGGNGFYNYNPDTGVFSGSMDSSG